MGRGLHRFRNTREFANHRSGGGERLKWKEDGEITTWMHTKMTPMPLWRHNVVIPVVYEDKKTKQPVTRAWARPFNCHEDSAILTDQYFHERGTTIRKKPPQRCGICKFVEWCWLQCELFEETRGDKKSKGLELTTEIFRFESDEPDKDTTVIHIGGVCGKFKPEKMDDAQKEAAKKAKIRFDKVFTENMYAKESIILAVVNNDDPAAGIYVTDVTAGLGGEIQDRLNEALDDHGRDIQVKPFAIKWKYNEKAKAINDKYKAVALYDLKPSGKVLSLIKGPEPEIPNEYTDLYNQQTMRAILEKACVLPKGTVPWDDLFPSKEQEKKWAEEDAREKEIEAKHEAGDLVDEGADDEDEKSFDDDGDEVVECECGKVIKAKLTDCPHCGAHFDVEDEEPDASGGDEGDDEEPEPESEKPAPKKASTMKTRAKKRSASSSDDDAQDDNVPF